MFTRYIDTETNQYIADDVGKCNRLDKCGYHYTPKQYFSDNSWREPVRSVSHIGKKTVKHEQKPPLNLQNQNISFIFVSATDITVVNIVYELFE